MSDAKQLLQNFLRERIRRYRFLKGFSQEKMAEILHVSSRSYLDQENGRYGFSALSLVYFMTLLPDEEILAFFREVHAVLEGREENCEDRYLLQNVLLREKILELQKNKISRNKFAERLKALRETSGMTQHQLGTKVNVTHQAIANYESGKRECSLDIFWTIAETFDVSADYLIGKEKREPQQKDS